MMGPMQVAQRALFNEFSIESFVPKDHPVRGIDRFLDLTCPSSGFLEPMAA